MELTLDVIKDDHYRSVNVLHAVQWAVDAWKHGFKPSTLVYCFQHSQVKVYGPVPKPVEEDDDINEVEKEI